MLRAFILWFTSDPKKEKELVPCCKHSREIRVSGQAIALKDRLKYIRHLLANPTVKEKEDFLRGGSFKPYHNTLHQLTKSQLKKELAGAWQAVLNLEDYEHSYTFWS